MTKSIKIDPKKTLSFILFFVLAFSFVSRASVLTETKKIEVEQEVELVDFIPDGYSYYISSYWSGEEIYPLVFFTSEPVFDSVPDTDTWGTFHHVYSSDGSDPLFYDFFSEDDLITYVETGVLPDNVRIRENYARYARLNTTPAIYYTNSALTYSDTGALYAASNPFTKTVIELVPGTETLFVGYTSGDLVNGILSHLLPLVPVVLVVLIGYFSIRKGVSFISSIVRGA